MTRHLAFSNCISTADRSSRAQRFITLLQWVFTAWIFGFWLAAERGVLAAHVTIVSGAEAWRWVMLPGRLGWMGEIFAGGALVVAVFAGVAWLSSRFNDRGDFCSGCGCVKARQTQFGRVLFVPAVAFALLGVAPALLLQILPHPSTGAWASMLLLLAGRTVVAAALWQALQIDRIISGAPRLSRGGAGMLLVVLAFAAVVVMGNSTHPFTGDEPSYLHAADSLVRHGSLYPPDDEADHLNKALNIDRAIRQHRFNRSDGSSAPLHFLGPSLAILPAYIVGRITGNLPDAVHGFMLIVFGATILLIGCFSFRITRAPCAALATAAVFAFSFPWIGISYQVYPEPFAALLTLIALCALAPALRGGEEEPTQRIRLSNKAINAVVWVCLALPWLHPRYALLSLALVGFACAWGGLGRRQIWRAAAVLCAGAIVFLAVHLVVFGNVIWKQNSPQSDLTGVLGMWVDSENGILLFAPWLLLLPAGWRVLAHNSSTRIPARRLVIVALALAAPLILLTSFSSTWNDGGVTAVRYFSPLLVGCAPLLAAALASRRGRHFATALLLTLPLAAALQFVREPLSGYNTGGQSARAVLDLAFSDFSLRELFPHLVYRDTGALHGNPLFHAVLVLATLVGAALWGSRRWSTNAVAAAACLVFAMLAWFAPLNQSLNFGVTATHNFTREAKRLGYLGRYEGRRLKKVLKRIQAKDFQETGRTDGPDRAQATLILPPSAKPFITYHRPRVAEGSTLNFFTENDHRPLLAGDFSKLPRGVYRLGLRMDAEGAEGVLSAGDQTTLTLEIRQSCYDSVFRTGPEVALTSTTLGEVVDGELVGQFVVMEEPRDVTFILNREGEGGLRLKKVVLDYLRREP